MAVEPHHFDFMAEAIREAETSIAQSGLPLSLLLIGESVTFPGSKDIPDQFGIPYIDLADDRSIDMMKSWRSNPANERLWQGDIGN